MADIIKGISFPFRIGTKGGVAMSTSDLYQSTHLAESIQQLLSTRVGERVMENIGANISYQVFEPNEIGTHTLIKYEIVEAIKQYEKRVTVTESDVEIEEKEGIIYVTVNFLVNDTGEFGSTVVQIGG